MKREEDPYIVCGAGALEFYGLPGRLMKKKFPYGPPAGEDAPSDYCRAIEF